MYKIPLQKIVFKTTLLHKVKGSNPKLPLFLKYGYAILEFINTNLKAIMNF